MTDLTPRPGEPVSRDDLAGLYQGPLEGFVVRRTELARRLRAAGDREGAAAVTAIRRPSTAVWAIDQLAAAAPELVAELLAAGLEAVEAQSRAAAGDDAAPLRDAAARVRTLVDVAAREAAGALRGAGHAVSEDSLRRVRSTVQAAITGSAATRRALLAGTLDRELDPPGFGVPASLEPDALEVERAIARHRSGPRPRPDGAGRPSPRARPRSPEGRGKPRDGGVDAVGVRAAEREEAGRGQAVARARELVERRRAHLDLLREETVRAEAELEQSELDLAAAERELEAARERLAELRRGHAIS